MEYTAGPPFMPENANINIKQLSPKGGAQRMSTAAHRNNFYILKEGPQPPCDSMEWWYGRWNNSTIPEVWYAVAWHWKERKMV